MNNLMPIFMKLENEPCLVVGGGKIALQKIYQLVDCKALVTAVSPKISKSISSLPVTTINRRYQTSDLEGVKLVIAATDDKEVNQKIFEDSNKRGLPVNVVDQPNLCSFYMGSVYEDGDLKVAVSTNGKCPSFSSYIKDHIKRIVGFGFLAITLVTILLLLLPEDLTERFLNIAQGSVVLTQQGIRRVSTIMTRFEFWSMSIQTWFSSIYNFVGLLSIIDDNLTE